MTPVIPALDPLPLPAPAGVLWFLLLLTFFLHVLAMNSVLGGSIIAATLRWRKGAGAHERELARTIAKAMPVAVSATVTLGVAALLFLQVLYGRLFFTSAVLMAWPWLAVVPLVIVAYYAIYALAFRAEAPRTGLALLVAAIVLVVAFIYANNMSLMLRPERFRDLYLASGRGLHLNWADRVLVPRYLHVVTGAVAVAGLLVSLAGLTRLQIQPAFARWAIGYGARWCMVATILNMATGVWFLGSLPVPVILLLIGKSPLAAGLLAGGILAAAVGVTLLMTATRAAAPRRPVIVAATALATAVALMLLVRDVVRREMLDLAHFPRQTWVSTEWSPVLLFGALLLLAIALVTWMVRALLTAQAKVAEPMNL